MRIARTAAIALALMLGATTLAEVAAAGTTDNVPNRATRRVSQYNTLVYPGPLTTRRAYVARRYGAAPYYGPNPGYRYGAYRYGRYRRY